MLPSYELTLSVNDKKRVVLKLREEWEGDEPTTTEIEMELTAHDAARLASLIDAKAQSVLDLQVAENRLLAQDPVIERF